MAAAYVILGVLILLVVLYDTFQTIILPRSVARQVRLTNILLAVMWKGWRVVGRRLGRRREGWLSGFGPLSLVMLIVCWAGLLALGFALIQEGLGTPLSGDRHPTFAVHLYMSATTLFTLGYGDMTALNAVGRGVSVVEAGVGFGFLAIVISYLPVLYQSFSRREATILLLDARAGAPPAGCELLCRSGGDMDALADILKEFERWSAGLLESYLSYPILAYYRSQHDKLTWLGALTAILDSCALLRLEFRVGSDSPTSLQRQATHTFAMARHVIVDLAYILGAAPLHSTEDRLPGEVFEHLHDRLETFGICLHRSADAAKRMSIMRREYEPYLEGLAHYLLLSVPPVWHGTDELDAWQESAWTDEAHFEYG